MVPSTKVKAKYGRVSPTLVPNFGWINGVGTIVAVGILVGMFVAVGANVGTGSEVGAAVGLTVNLGWGSVGGATVLGVDNTDGSGEPLAGIGCLDSILPSQQTRSPPSVAGSRPAP